MRNKLGLLIFSITALVLTVVLFVIGLNYIAIALIAGVLVIGHREIWSLTRYRKLPPIDERVRENTGKAIRNSFIFLIIALTLTIFYYAVFPFDYTLFGWEYIRISPLELIQQHIENFIAELLLMVEAAYLLSYLYYDRIQSGVEKRMFKSPKLFLLVSVISPLIFALNVCFMVLNPVTSFALLHIIINYVAIFGFVIGIMGSLFLFIRGLLVKAA